MATSIKLPLAPNQVTSQDTVIVVGAGIAGLAAALRLSAQGVSVTVIEKARHVGGKIRQSPTALGPIDSGPTVFTMRWVFDQLFAEAGQALEQTIAMERLECLAHHRWPDGSRLNLYADPQRSRDAIGRLAGLREARNFDRFRRDTHALHDALLRPFMLADQPGLTGLVRKIGFRGLLELGRTSPFRSLHQQLQRYFRDPRLLQLFGRYATYCGSSPYSAPASLALIAHVEQAGVWQIRGGMAQLAIALREAAERLGAKFMLGKTVTSLLCSHDSVRGVVLADGGSLSCSALVLNADVNALGEGLFGAEAAARSHVPKAARRSLSAVTWTGTMTTADPDLSYHNVFFSQDYAAEFRHLFEQHEIPAEPTVYLCAPDRTGSSQQNTSPERWFALVNAPAVNEPSAENCHTTGQANRAAASLMARCGFDLNLEAVDISITTPADFRSRFPATGGALYGSATHGWRAAFQRPGSTTRLGGLYLAGGSIHPGPGVPMAALSGLSAANHVLAQLRLVPGKPVIKVAHA